MDDIYWETDNPEQRTLTVESSSNNPNISNVNYFI